MKYSRHARFLLAIALVVTVPLKLLIQSAPESERVRHPDKTIAAFLARHNYEPRVEQRPAGTFVYATSGACRLLIRLASPYSGNLDSINISARDVGPLVFVFNGSVDPRPPISATLLYHYRQRLRELLGFRVTVFPLLAVAASDGCSVESLPWREIAGIS